MARLGASIEAAAKRYFGRDASCLKKRFTIIVPQYTGKADSGCPGSLEPCHIRTLTAHEQRKVCDNKTDAIDSLMQRTFGTGSTKKRTIGSWINPETREVIREKGVEISTRYKGTCLVPGASDKLIGSIDSVMKGLCQTQWFFETEKTAVMAWTGAPSRH